MAAAERELVKIKPEAYAAIEPFTFTSAVARQRLDPATHYMVLRVHANLDTSGPPPYPTGRTIRTHERDVLDMFYVAWPASASLPSDNAERYKAAAMDKSDPLAFWLFPTPTPGHAVSIVAVRIPPVMSAVGDTLPLSDLFIPALTQYVCYAAMRSEQRAESTDNSSKYLDAFLALLGKTREVLRQVGPDQPRAPEANQ